MYQIKLRNRRVDWDGCVTHNLFNRLLLFLNTSEAQRHNMNDTSRIETQDHILYGITWLTFVNLIPLKVESIMGRELHVSHDYSIACVLHDIIYHASDKSDHLGCI